MIRLFTKYLDNVFVHAQTTFHRFSSINPMPARFFASNFMICQVRHSYAGCDNEEIIAHCRSEGAHVRGCWVVDLLTGRE
jgi:hypothetical protein